MDQVAERMRQTEIAKQDLERIGAIMEGSGNERKLVFAYKGAAFPQEVVSISIGELAANINEFDENDPRKVAGALVRYMITDGPWRENGGIIGSIPNLERYFYEKLSFIADPKKNFDPDDERQRAVMHGIETNPKELALQKEEKREIQDMFEKSRQLVSTDEPTPGVVINTYTMPHKPGMILRETSSPKGRRLEFIHPENQTK